MPASGNANPSVPVNNDNVVLPPVSSQAGNVDAALSELSLALRRYVVQTKSAPKSFAEFIAATHIQPPPPPAGKQYAIEHGAVVLIND